MPTETFSANVAQLVPSATLALAARARGLRAEGVDVVDLSAGEPHHPGPEQAARAAIRAVEDGEMGYQPTPGTPRLREAIARYLTESTAVGSVESGAVVVSAGVKQALFNCCFALFGDGDEVLVPAPYWPSYPAIVRLARAEPVVVETSWREEYLVSVDALEEARTDRTRGLLLNSPSNPTGAVYDLERLGAILRWCAEHDIWVLSDEIYRRIAFDGARAPSVFDVPDRGRRVVLLDGISKAFCMPGLRIGYAVGPTDLVEKTTDLQGQTTSGAASLSQFAAAAALEPSERREAFLAELVSHLEKLRGLGLETMGRIDALDVRAPAGALYLYARLRGDESSLEVAERLLVDSAVACVPGEPFGSPGHLRFNFAVEENALREGLRRIETFFA